MDFDEQDDLAALGNEATRIIGRLLAAALAIGFLVIAAPVYVYADDLLTKFDKVEKHKWFVTGCCSWHADHGGRTPPRQINPGIGMEYGTKDFRLVAGGFINSKSRDSGYFGIRHNLYDITDQWSFGYMAAFVSGYGGQNAPAMQPVLIPTFSLEGKEWGLNILAAPGWFSSRTSVLGLSFKRRF